MNEKESRLPSETREFIDELEWNNMTLPEKLKELADQLALTEIEVAEAVAEADSAQKELDAAKEILYKKQAAHNSLLKQINGLTSGCGLASNRTDALTQRLTETIYSLGITGNAAVSLKKYEITTVGDLIKCTESELKSMGLSDFMVNKIRGKLISRGLNLK